MKKFTVLTVLFVLIFSMYSLSKEKIRVGVYDSRAIAVWFFRSDASAKEMKALVKEMKEASEKKDSVQMKKIREKGQLHQRIAHDKGFGRGSVSEILENYSKEIETIAVKQNLVLVLNKWEVNYGSQDVELVDITNELLKELKAPEDVIKMADEMKKHKPMKDAFYIED